jgi:hypothetical protein
MSNSISGRVRTPPDLKWLLNERAAIAGRIEKATARCSHFTERLARLQKSVEVVNRKVQDALDSKSHLQQSLGALDATIGLAYSRVRPNAAGVINVWEGKRRKRGALATYIKQTLQSAAPEAVNTRFLIDNAIQKFELLVSTPADRTRVKWAIASVIRKLNANGLIELALPQTHAAPGAWRWKPPTSFADITAKAQRLAKAKEEARNARSANSNPS